MEPWATGRAISKITEKKDKYHDHEYRDTKFTILSNLVKEANRVVNYNSKHPSIHCDIDENSLAGAIVNIKLTLDSVDKEVIANDIISGVYNCGWNKYRNEVNVVYGNIKNNSAYVLGYCLANVKEKPSILIKQWCDAFRAVDVHAAKW